MRVEHEPHEDVPASLKDPNLHRTLGCPCCGHLMTVNDGAEALERKRRLQAGLPAEADETHKAFLEQAEAVAKVWPL